MPRPAPRPVTKPHNESGDASKPLSAVVIGCGPIGLMHAAAIDLSADAQLAAICDVDKARLDGAARLHHTAAYSSSEELLREVDPAVVTIATPNHLHVEPCRHALQHGCHVFCEKPLATDVSAAQELVELAERQGLQLAVNYNRRFGFGYQQAKRWIADDRIGRLRQLTLHVSDRIPPPHIATEPAVMLSSLLVHHFDLVRWLAGEVRRVTCLATKPEHGLIRRLSITLELINGTLAIINANYRDGQSRTHELAILAGEKGEIQVEDVTRQASLTGLNVDEVVVAHPPHFESGDYFYHSLKIHLLDFLERLAAGKTSSVSGRDGLAGLLIGAAAKESLRRNESVEMNE